MSTRPMSSSNSTKVFSILELATMILENLTFKNLVTVASVNKLLHSIITTAPTLRAILFRTRRKLPASAFRSHKQRGSNSIKTLVRAHYVKLNQAVFPQHAPLSKLSNGVFRLDLDLEKLQQICVPSSPWAGMYLTQPPMSSLRFANLYDNNHHGTLTVNNMFGVTLADIQQTPNQAFGNMKGNISLVCVARDFVKLDGQLYSM